MGYAQLYIKPKTKTRLEASKERYNIFLKQHKPLEEFLDNSFVSYEIRERKIPGFRQLCRKINSVILQIRREGYEPTHEEIIGGFINNTNIVNITSEQGKK